MTRDDTASTAHSAPATPKESEPKQTVLVISSHVMTGAVGNRAAAFALERLGHPVWEVPTILLPWHPGHGPSTRHPIDAEIFTQSLKDIEKHPDFAKLGAVLTGYIGDAAQIPAIAHLVDALKKANPDALYVCDPVMGEEHGLYIPKPTALSIKSELVPRADIITPNRFEFNWLTQTQASRNEELIKAASALNRPTTLITSAFAMMRASIANLLITRGDEQQEPRALLCDHRAIDNPPNGTGDMVSALFLAHKLAGRADEQALKLTSSAIFEVVARSVHQGYKDLEVARFADRFATPMAMVNCRMIGAAPKRAPKRIKPESL